MTSQRGFAPIIFVLIMLIVSAGIVSGAFYLKNKSNQMMQNETSSSNINSSTNPVTNPNTSSPSPNNSTNSIDSIVHPSDQRQAMILMSEELPAVSAAELPLGVLRT